MNSSEDKQNLINNLKVQNTSQTIFLCDGYDEFDDNQYQLYGEAYNTSLRPGMQLQIQGLACPIVEVYGNSGAPDVPDTEAPAGVPAIAIVIQVPQQLNVEAFKQQINAQQVVALSVDPVTTPASLEAARPYVGNVEAPGLPQPRSSRLSLVAGIIVLFLGIAFGIITSLGYFSEKKEASQKQPTTKISILDDSLTTSLPEDLKLIEKQADIALYGQAADGSKDLYIGQASFRQGTDTFGSPNLNEKEAQAFINGGVYRQEMKNQYTTNFCPDVLLQEPKKITVTGASSAFQTDFTCPKQSDGSEYGGLVAEIFTPDTHYTVKVAAEKDTWLAQPTAWDGIIADLQIEK